MRTPLNRLLNLQTSSAAAALLVSAALFAGGCGSNDGWGLGGSSDRSLTPQQRADKMPQQHEEFDALGYRLAWRGFADVLPGETVERLDVLGDVVVVQDTGSVLSVIEPASGVRRWSDQVAGRLTKFLGNVRVDENLLVSSESELFIFDLPSSTLKTKQSFGMVVDTRPAVVGDVLVYGTISGEILGHNYRTGFREWGSALTGAISQNPVMVGEQVGLVSYTGQVIILDGLTGTSSARVQMYDGCATPPAGSESVMYCASRDHALYAFSNDGHRLWRFLTDAPIYGKPVHHEGVVYCDLPRLGLTALDALTGVKKWNAESAHGEVIGVRAGRLVTWDGSNLALIDPATGDVIERKAIKNVSILKTDQFVDGNLYAVSPLGVVAKYGAKK